MSNLNYTDNKISTMIVLRTRGVHKSYNADWYAHDIACNAFRKEMAVSNQLKRNLDNHCFGTTTNNYADLFQGDVFNIGGSP